jgi:hypothetical protein
VVASHSWRAVVVLGRGDQQCVGLPHRGPEFRDRAGDASCLDVGVVQGTGLR